MVSQIKKSGNVNVFRTRLGSARLVTKTRRVDHITPIIRKLHWLPVRKRSIFKTFLFTYKVLNGLAPSYLAELINLTLMTTCNCTDQCSGLRIMRVALFHLVHQRYGTVSLLMCGAPHQLRLLKLGLKRFHLIMNLSILSLYVCHSFNLSTFIKICLN